MSTGWKLVEAVVDKNDNNDNAAKDEKKIAQKRHINKSKNRPRNQQQAPTDFLSLNSVDRENTLRFVVDQINYLFSESNLCLDTFLRSYMDEAGYVPLALVSCYSNVAPYGVPIPDLVAAIQALSPTELEVDVNFQTVKVKNKWEMWLMPNGLGGRGLPLYSTQLVAYDQTYYDELQYPEQGNEQEAYESSADQMYYYDNSHDDQSFIVAADGTTSTEIDQVSSSSAEATTTDTVLPPQPLSAASFSSHALSPNAAEFKPGSSIGK